MGVYSYLVNGSNILIIICYTVKDGGSLCSCLGKKKQVDAIQMDRIEAAFRYRGWARVLQ
jgi:hypothetical protein